MNLLVLSALRGLFIIDPEGIIRSIQINDDAVGRSVEETLRILKAFQWADGHVGKYSSRTLLLFNPTGVVYLYR